jgi:hypothetical protein
MLFQYFFHRPSEGASIDMKEYQILFP